MAFSRAVRVRSSAAAAWKWLVSFRKRDWTLADYPVGMTLQETDPATVRFRHHPYRAYVINWHLAGTGHSPEQAWADLKDKFAAAVLKLKQEGKTLPRPGNRVPIEFAWQEEVSRNEELSQDFVRRVLGLEWAWISDESSLWDFHTEQTNGHLYTKIRELYGVDVSDIESAKLWEVLDRIEGVRNTL